MRKKLRISLVVGMLMALTVMSGPAEASPLQSVTASSFGLHVTGLLEVGPTPTATASFPPATDDQREALLEVPLGALAYEGLAVVRAQTTTDSTLNAAIFGDALTVQGGAARPAGYNARGYAQVDGTALVISSPLDIVDLPEGLNEPGAALVTAGAVTAEALVSCVDGNPVFVTGSRIIGPLEVAGLSLADPVDGLVNQVIDLVGDLAVLDPIVRISTNVIEERPNGIAVTALRVEVLSEGLVLNIAQAEVSGAVCAPLEAPAIEPLPRTGGDNAGMGAGIAAGGLMLLLAGMRLRRPNHNSSI